MNTVKERLLYFIKYKGLSQAKFEKSCGFSNGYINNIRKGISPEKLQSIVQFFPDLSREWLIFGTGSMLRPSLPDGTSLVSGRDNNINSNVVNGGTSDVAAEVEKLRAENALLRQIVKEKERIIEEKERTISLLMQSR